jgi:hypothetical protein
MTSVFQPPPTYALPVVVDEITGKSIFNPIWLRWFIDLSKNFTATATGNHESLSGLLGGGANNHYHLTSAQVATALAATNWAAPGTIGSTTPNTIKGTTVQATTNFVSSDGSTGYTGTITTASLVGKTVTIKDGIITSIV